MKIRKNQVFLALMLMTAGGAWSVRSYLVV